MAFEVDELTAAVYTAQIKDGLVAVSVNSLETLELTLYDSLTGAVINGRDHQNVLNAHDVTVDTNGLLTWQLRIADNPIVGTSLVPVVKNSSGRLIEVHYAFFRAVWDSGTKAANKVVQLNVLKYDKLPT